MKKLVELLGGFIFNILFEYIKEYTRSMKIENAYLAFSGIIYIVLTIIIKTFINIKDMVDGPVIGSLLMLLLCLFTLILARFCSKKVIVLFLANKISKHGIYEKRENHYYLKEEYKKSRELLGKLLASPFSEFFLVLLVFVLFFMSNIAGVIGDDDLIETLQAIDEMLGYFLFWLYLKAEYYSGQTYEEAKAFFEEKPKKKMGMLKVLDGIVNHTMCKSIKQLQTIAFPMKYGIRYPAKTFSDHYKAFYEALLNGENIYVEDIFYHDWGNAFFIPLHRMLLQSKRAVILLGPSLDMEDVKLWLEEGLRKLLIIERSWNIRAWSGNFEKSDIYIVPFEDISDYIRGSSLLHKEDRGIFCVVLEPSIMVLRMQYFLEQYATSLRAMKSEPVYCFAERNMIGLRDCLSHVFMCRILQIEVVLDSCQQIYVCTSETGENEEVKAYWGIRLGGSGCGSVYFSELLKNSVHGIEYISKSIVPVNDLCCLIKDKLAVTHRSQADRIELQNAFDSAKYYKGIWGIKRTDKKCFIITDDYCHWYDLFWLLSTRGDRESYIFLLSGDYLLFDFMVKNAHRLLRVRNAIPVFFPIYQDSDRNRLLRLFRLFASSFLLGRREVDVVFPEWAGATEEEICHYLNDKVNWFFGYKAFERINGKLGIRQSFLNRNAYLWKRVLIIDEETDRESFDCLLACHMDQIWAEGQYIVRDGCYYQIREIRDREIVNVADHAEKEKEVVLLRSNGIMQHTGCYYQNRKYRVKIKEFVKTGNRDDGFSIFKGYADISVITKGWYLEHFDTEPQIELSVNTRGPGRKYRNKQVLFLSLENRDICFWQNISKILMRIVRTIYPDFYPYLGFMPVYKSKENDKSGMYVIEDCVDDFGLLESFEMNWDRIMKLCLEYGKASMNLTFARGRQEG